MHPFLILGFAIAFVLIAILWLRMHAFSALILAALFVAACTPQQRLAAYAEQQVAAGRWNSGQAERFLNDETFGGRVAQQMGSTIGNIGILIAAASIIGKCLLESGAAERIVQDMMRWFGEQRAGITFVGSGFLLGIPVFFDTVFYLMIPLGKAAARRTQGHYLFYVLTIVAGGTMAHSLVPPTPGPLLVVEQFGVNLGLMMLVGMLIGLVASTAGYFFARWLDRRMTISIPDDHQLPLGVARDEQRSRESDRPLPALSVSLLPVLLPILLIGAGTIVDVWVTQHEPNAAGDHAAWVNLIRTLGDRNVALVIAAAISVLLLARAQPVTRKGLAIQLQTALMGAGMIILITGAGGAFGGAIRQSGIATEIGALTGTVQSLWLLPLAFFVTMLIRTAQGSATVAMITAASVLQGFVRPETLDFNAVYLAAAVGCGSKPIAWMADSGFWVICKMSGMSESEGLRTITPMSIVMGLTGLLATIAAAICFPLKS